MLPHYRESLWNFLPHSYKKKNSSLDGFDTSDFCKNHTLCKASINVPTPYTFYFFYSGIIICTKVYRANQSFNIHSHYLADFSIWLSGSTFDFLKKLWERSTFANFTRNGMPIFVSLMTVISLLLQYLHLCTCSLLNVSVTKSVMA